MSSSINADVFYQKYLKYKKKYLEIKSIYKNNQEGGDKRLLKNISEEDIVIANPIGSPNSMNKFLLEPEVNYIYNICSKKKNFKKLCSRENLTDLLTFIININQTHGDFNQEIDHLVKYSKLSKEFINEIIKNHQEYIKNNTVKE